MKQFEGITFAQITNREVVYFGQDDWIINKSSGIAEIGAKEHYEDGLLCYCYEFTRAEANSNPRIRNFIV